MKSKACAYCGAKPAGTVDHIPPRSFFPDPRPANLITVPCCRRCNSTFSLDDQYVLTVLAFRKDVATQPGLEQVYRRALGGVFGRARQGLHKVISETVHRVDLLTASGLWLPNQDYFLVDRKRLVRWMERVFKGLYWHEYGVRLPDGFTVTAGFGEEFPLYVAQCVAWFQRQDLRSRGDGVFDYKWMPTADRPDASIWCAEFFRCVPILGFIHPRNLNTTVPPNPD